MFCVHSKLNWVLGWLSLFVQASDCTTALCINVFSYAKFFICISFRSNVAPVQNDMVCNIYQSHTSFVFIQSNALGAK